MELDWFDKQNYFVGVGLADYNDKGVLGRLVYLLDIKTDKELDSVFVSIEDLCKTVNISLLEDIKEKFRKSIAKNERSK